MMITIQIAIAKSFYPCILSLLLRLGTYKPPELVFPQSLLAILGLAHFAAYDTRAISGKKASPDANV
jgi:hypothetical protein